MKNKCFISTISFTFTALCIFFQMPLYGTAYKKTVFLNSVQDTYVQQDNPFINEGSSPMLFVQDTLGGYWRTYVQFDISSIPSHLQIISAKLNIYNEADKYITTEPHYVFPVAGPWNEMTLIWNTQPGYRTDFSSGLFITPTPSWYQYDVRLIVEAWKNGTFPN